MPDNGLYMPVQAKRAVPHHDSSLHPRYAYKCHFYLFYLPLTFILVFVSLVSEALLGACALPTLSLNLFAERSFICSRIIGCYVKNTLYGTAIPLKQRQLAGNYIELERICHPKISRIKAQRRPVVKIAPLFPALS